MAHYVMSDIHGEGARFYAMLERIGFGPADTLYILGDVIDRGTDGVALLRYILASPNMVLLMGNHENMCVDYFSPKVTYVEILRWNRNGNAHTLLALEQMGEAQRNALLEQLAGLPDYLELTVNGREFYLVHGFPADNKHDRIWGRPDYYTPNPLPGKTVIVGHTPVVVFSSREPVRDHLRILHAPGFIDIDCGCGHRPDTRRLACLRLEDMAEFYC